MRKVALVLGVALVPATFLMQSVSAVPVARSNDSPPVVAQLVYVDVSGALKLATIADDGTITSSQTIGPVTTPSSGKATIYGPVVSTDGSIAWTEDDQSGKSYSSWIVLRPAGGGQPEKINTSKNQAEPIGFVGQHLVVCNFDGKAWVVETGTHPTLKLIASSRQDGTFFGTDAAGVVYERGFALPGKPERIELLRLNGHSKLLHTFPGSMFKGNKAPLEQGWVDPDGLNAVFEQGDHTDFGGVGPTSEAFSISLLSPSSVVRLGHPGASSPIQRMAGTSFAAGTPYSVWALTDARVPTGSVYGDNGNGWQLIASNSLVVAGNHAGFLITQPAKYVDAGVGAPAYNIQPTGDAVLHFYTASFPVALEATQMVWLN